MLFSNRLFMLGLFCIGITAAATAQAGNQLFKGSWTVKAFGNECSVADPSPGPHCGNGASESWVYSAFGLPQGILCNPNQPRCPFDSTPTDGLGNFAPLGGSQGQALFCAPWSNWQGLGTTARPAKGGDGCLHRYSGTQASAALRAARRSGVPELDLTHDATTRASTTRCPHSLVKFLRGSGGDSNPMVS
jgi:hypothetical protein